MSRFVLIFYCMAMLNAINPPENGTFPEGVLDRLEEQGIGRDYGNQGWINKISKWRSNSHRDAQLEFNIPVLLGKYADVSSTYFSASDFQNLLFDNNPTGTMKEYYHEISYGNFLVDGVAGGWYQSNYTMTNAVEQPKQFVAEIASLADPDFNFAQFDNDGPDNIPNSGDDDGYVDGIIVVYSGCGAEWGEGNNNLWPHMSNLGSYEYTTNDLGANGSNIIISSYAVSPELAGGGDCYTDIIRPMGVYAHEFGHILGLPDLYDRTSNDGDSEGLGEWCLMASGSWSGWAGDTPAHMSAWCKSELGWVEPTILIQDELDFQIPQINSTPFSVKIWEDDYNWSRYFLIENRQAVGFDSDINGSGILIYHIDENRRYGANRWSSGSVNDNVSHKLVDLEEADGFDHLDLLQNRGDSGDPYPGSSSNNTFNNNSTPSSNRYNGDDTGISISNISLSDSLMTADIIIRDQIGYALSYDEMGISGWGWGYQDPQNTYGGVLFTPSVSGYLTEVDIGIKSAPLNFQVLVYDSFSSNTPGNLIQTKDVSVEEDGWHSISIDAMEVSANVDFFIVVKINEAYAISYDNSGPLSGRSYTSDNGNSYSNNISNYGDINIRSKISYLEQLSLNYDSIIPNKVVLSNAYPNPFNPLTNIEYTLNNSGYVSLNIYDLSGSKVKSLINKYQGPGSMSIIWDGSNDNGQIVAAGMYIYMIKIGEVSMSKKMVLLK